MLKCLKNIEDEEIHKTIDKDISKFKLNQDDEVWYDFCIDTVDYFVSGDPICMDSQEDIKVLTNKLNEFIKANPNFEYKRDEYDIYSNEDVRKFIKYINFVRDQGFVLWCSR